MRNPKHMSNKLELYSKRMFVLESKIIAVIGFFLIGGSIGGYDNNVMTFGKMITYIAIGICLMVSGFFGVKYFEGFEDDDEEENETK